MLINLNFEQFCSSNSLKLKCTKYMLFLFHKTTILRYHAWMDSEELRELTASELLPLDEEYEMQKKWRLDNDSKNDFIMIIKFLM